MKLRFGNLATVSLLSAALCVLVAVPSAQAYSIYPDAGTSTSHGGPQAGFSWSAAWNEVMAPFQNFANTLQGVQSNTIPTVQPFNPSTQIQSMIPSKDTILSAMLNFFSVITGWLIGLADQLAMWILSLVK